MANSTNPRYKTFMQETYTAGDENQFDENISRREVKLRPIDTSNNVFFDDAFAFDHTKYSDITSRAVHDTFAYIFYKFKKAVYASIIDGKLQTYLPFTNVKYRNEWSHLIQIDKTKYTDLKALLDKSNNIMGYAAPKFLPVEKWYANDAMFRYDNPTKLYDGHHVLVIKDMLSTLCAERDVPDIEVFINSRDYPILKIDGTEPYENLYGSSSYNLVSHNYSKYSPILSCSISEGFADVLIPTYEDWARARYQRDAVTLPTEYKKYPVISQQVEWNAKKSMAVFRGSTTGSGVTPSTNQRLKALELCELNPTYLDVGIVKWNTRVRKHITSKYLQTIERKTYPIVNSLSLQDQTNKYKYILTLEGHVAAYRLSYELSSGSVIILADSKWKIWYSRFLKPFVHYVPVKNDLSNLIETIEWCRNHDDECQSIVANAQEFYRKYLNADAILDYLQHIFVKLAIDIGGYSWLPNLLKSSLSEEKAMLNKLILERYLPECKFPIRSGPRCIGKLVASSKVLQRARALEFLHGIFSNKTTTIDCVRTNGFLVARKTISTDIDKQKEQCHEAYIGIFAINDVIRKCPNFAYTYGYKNDNNYITYSEYIHGPTLSQWILSPMYHEKDLLNIMCAINLGLEVAQNYCGFVHYDLTPWNIIIQMLPTPIAFDYVVGSSGPLRYTYHIIPVMIDYGKSRAVVYEPEHGLIDRGYINLFKSESRAIDVLTLVYSIINNLLDAHKPVPRVLYGFIQQFNLPSKVMDYKDAWELINYVNDRVNIADSQILKITPMTFIEYVSTAVPFIKISSVQHSDYTSKMSKGHAVFEENLMALGNYNLAVTDTVNRLYRQTIPKSSNALIHKFIKSLIASNITDLNEIVEAITDNIFKQKYALIRNKIMADTQYKSTEIIPNFPVVPNGYLKMDSYLTPEELDSFLEGVIYTPDNWISVYSMCSDVAASTPLLDIFGINGPDYDTFKHLNEIASNNTLLWIRHVV